MKNKFLIMSIIMLVISIILCMKTNTITCNKINAGNNIENCEMKAVWVPFMSLNMVDTDYSEESFKKKFDNIINESKRHNCNTLIVQVRPFSDALYKSNYYPWSHLISSEQGKDPGFDPLAYMIESTHKANMKIHAWINPLRIQLNDSPKKLCETNIYYNLKNDKNNPEDIIMETKNGKFLNPGYEKVRELIKNGTQEIVKNYDIDGIQYDDYFYPTSKEYIDKNCYETYCNSLNNSNPKSLGQWRFENVNLLISEVYKSIKETNSHVVFGISPAGNIKYNEEIGADVNTWCSEPGYIDYICPQIYFSLDHPKLPALTAANQWKNLIKNKNLKLYFGLALYKAGSDMDKGTWKNRSDILKTQIEEFRQLGCDGFMLFSFEDFSNKNACEEIQNVVSVLN